MSTDRLQAAVPSGEALRYSDELRGSGAVGLTDERLLVVEDEVTSVELPSVDSVELQAFDWFLGFMSVLLVGLGLFLTRESVLGGLGLAAAGVASLYLTYRKRGEASVVVRGRAKPIKLHPDDLRGFREAFERAVARYEAEMEA